MLTNHSFLFKVSAMYFKVLLLTILGFEFTEDRASIGAKLGGGDEQRRDLSDLVRIHLVDTLHVVGDSIKHQAIKDFMAFLFLTLGWTLVVRVQASPNLAVEMSKPKGFQLSNCFPYTFFSCFVLPQAFGLHWSSSWACFALQQ